MNELIQWQPENNKILPSGTKSPIEISNYAIQLRNKDKKQILSAFKSEHYEIAINYLWQKTVMALKKELASVGITLLGEMLGRADVDEDDDVEDILTTKDAIRLAEELGVISSTEGMRLRHTDEMVTHFSRLEEDDEEIDELEALSALKACVIGVLGRPKVEVANKFIVFREALEGKSLDKDDPQVEMLKSSPYFFYKLTISVLMNASKNKTGANLEHVLANVNIIIPTIWLQLREAEKWQIGRTYAEVYADGKTTSVKGLKSALLKVHGFDFVPENLRSDTFIKAAEAIIKAHEEGDNFYNEPVKVRSLVKLGTVIPAPALPLCFSALICVILGNSYGVSWDARDEAYRLLNKMTSDRWIYYFNSILPSDIRILNKLSITKPINNFINLVDKLDFSIEEIKNKSVKQLLVVSKEKDEVKVEKISKKLYVEYYGKK